MALTLLIVKDYDKSSLSTILWRGKTKEQTTERVVPHIFDNDPKWQQKVRQVDMFYLQPSVPPQSRHGTMVGQHTTPLSQKAPLQRSRLPWQQFQ